MADQKITDLTEITEVDGGDFLNIVDVSDTTDDVAGSSKKVTIANLGSKVLIETITLSTAGEFDFDNIPQGFNRLIIHGQISSVATGVNASLFSYVNGDRTHSNYRTQYEYSKNSELFGVGAAAPFCGQVVGATGARGVSDIEISIEGYGGTIFRKKVKGTTDSMANATELRIFEAIAVHNSDTAAITSLILADSAGLIGTLHLYGEM